MNLLPFYFEKVLKASSLLPPPYSYGILPFTGHLFRNWAEYSGSMAEPGVLLHATLNLQKCLGVSEQKAYSIVSEFLKFESRYVLENNWIATKQDSKIKGAFSLQSQKNLYDVIFGRQCIICTLHSANLFLMGALLDILKCRVAFMLALIPDQIPEHANPLHQNGIRMIMGWNKWQYLIKANMQQAREVISQGYSLIMAPDTPGYSNRGVMVSMFGMKIWVPVGAAKLASEFDIPIVVAIPWAKNALAKYEVSTSLLSSNHDLQLSMANFFSQAETAISRNYACWAGWLCLHQMFIDKQQ